jgi:hypothetical protein
MGLSLEYDSDWKTHIRKISPGKKRTIGFPKKVLEGVGFK